MRASKPADVSSTSTRITLRLPLSQALSGSNAPQAIDSASTGFLSDASPACTAVSLGGEDGNNPLWETESNDDDFSGITDLVWDNRRVCASPRPILHLDDLSEFTLDTSHLETPLAPSRFGEWATGWPFDSEEAEPSPLSIPSQVLPFAEHSGFPELEEYGSPYDIWSIASASSTCTTEPASPSSLPPTAPLHAMRIGRHDSTSSRGSLRADHGHIRRVESEPLKRPIKPLRQSKATYKDAGDVARCEICKHSFTYKKDLDRHRSSVHISNPNWFCPVQECKYAKRGFSRKDKAFQHVKTHQRGMDIVLEPIFKENSALAHTMSWDESSSGAQNIVRSLSMPIERSTSVKPSPIDGSEHYDASRSGKPRRNNTYTSQKEVRAYVCSFSGCNSTFVHRLDLRRHSRTMHTKQKAGDGYSCTSEDCKGADRVWSRIDSFKLHILKTHPSEDVDRLLRKSSKLRNGTGDSISATVATPDVVLQPYEMEDTIYQQSQHYED